jgi:hypothetical protein
MGLTLELTLYAPGLVRERCGRYLVVSSTHDAR